MHKRFFVVLAIVAVSTLGWALAVLTGDAHDGDRDWMAAPDQEKERFAAINAKWDRDGSAAVFTRRPTSPASNFLEQWIRGDPDEAKALLAAAENAVPAPARVSEQEPGWGAYTNALTDPFFMHDVVEACGPRVAPPENCLLGIRVVASPEETGGEPRSRLNFARIEGTQPETQECRAYASCVAHAMVGRQLPALPSGNEERVGLAMTWHMDAWNDQRIQKNRDRIQDCIALSTEALAMLPDEPMNLEEERSRQIGEYSARLDWCEMLLADLDNA